MMLLAGLYFSGTPVLFLKLFETLSNKSIIITILLASFRDIFDSFHRSLMVGFGFVGYSMPNPPYAYILNIYDLFCFGFMAYQPL